MKRFVAPPLLLFVVLSGLLSGCLLPGTDSGPTPYPPEYLPTVIVLTGQAAMETAQADTPSPAPTVSPTITDTPVLPTFPPTDTATPAPSARNAQIQIQSPGPMSKVISPLHLRMQIVSGGSQLVQVDLQGEDGRLLARKLERVETWPGGFYLSLKIPFEITAAAELGRLTVSTKDGEGRLEALAANHVILLSVGPEEIAPVHDFSDRVVLYNPGTRDEGINGSLFVEGRFLPFNDQQVVLELLDEEGDTLGLRVLDFNGTDEQSFSTTIPYKISEPTEARLILRQEDDRLEGLIYLYSRLIILNP
jgi:hypothetical protein